AGTSEADLVITPSHDTGPVMLEVTCTDVFDGETHSSTDDVGIEWTAPWLPQVATCGEVQCLPIGSSIAGEVELGVNLPWDAARLDHVEVMFDGVVPTDDAPEPDRVRFS